MVTARNDPNYGKGAHSISTSDAEELGVDTAQIEELLVSSFRAAGYQPPLLPSTAIELMQLARRPDVTFPMVAALLQKEPLLATQVLRIAQSPVYRRAEPVRSLEQAASLLGLRALADLFLQASLTARVFRAPAYEGTMNRLRDHAVATAITARLVCRQTAFSDDYAFLCGLLHDVGTAACIIVLADSAARGKTDPLPLHLVWPVINGMHEAMSDRLAEIRQLPADVRLVIGHHHSLAIGGAVHPMAAVVAVADSIASDLGHALDVGVNRTQPARAEASLNLSAAQLRSIRQSAEKLLPTP